ncbi:hypothetical protein TNCV_4696881 [Trichonephila clavipes]|nr:hypothetical protein TNCV_4696881 [Trichonephila clavipes]
MRCNVLFMDGEKLQPLLINGLEHLKIGGIPFSLTPTLRGPVRYGGPYRCGKGWCLRSPRAVSTANLFGDFLKN